MNSIFESKSPVCHIDAVISAEKNAYYLYFFCSPEYGAKVLNMLWICNRCETPDELDLSGLNRGEGPVLGKENVSELQPQGGMELNPAILRCVWFDTGDAAAIYYGKKLIAVIPPIAGLYDFPGFSIFAKGQTRYAWGMPEGPDLENIINENKKFWETAGDESVWENYKQAQLAAVDKFFGCPHTQCSPAGKERFPYRSLVQGQRKNMIFNFTLGMSQYAMPRIAHAFGNNCSDQSRTELGFATVERHLQLLELMAMVMKDVADIPWDERSFLWHGHTLDFTNIGGFAAILFVNPVYIEGMESPEWPGLAGGRVNTLWMIPISAAELDFLRQKGVEELIKLSGGAKQICHIFDGIPKFLHY